MKNRNVLRLSLYQAFMSASISVPGSWILMDMLLLRMHIDIRLFGMIKSSMFLVPAIVYWLLANRLRDLRIAPAVCRWAYLLRITIPLCLPLTALYIGSASIRMAICIAVFSSSFSLAMIANNTLLTVSRAAVEPGVFNKYSLFFYSLQSLPASLMGYPVARVLANPSLDDRSFLLLFFAIEVVVSLLYIPAFICLRDLDMKTQEDLPRTSFKEHLMPFIDRGFRTIFAFTALRAFWMGMLSTYWTVHLLSIRGWRADSIVIFETAMMFALLFVAPLCGKLADRKGYRLCFLVMTLLSIIAAYLNIALWTSPLVLFIAMLVNNNGCVGIISTCSLSLLSSAVVATAPKGHSERYIAAYSLFNSLGAFGGCCMASRLFAFLSDGAEANGALYRQFFLITSFLLLPQMACSMMLKKRK